MKKTMNLLFNLILLTKLISFVHCAPDRDPYKSCACGELGHFVKIVGGKEAKPHSYPWTAALVGFPEEGKFFCGATIVSSRFLITAGHCYYEEHKDWSYDKIRVQLGVHNLTDKNILTIKPKAFKRYEGFTEENDIDAPLMDIALIELEEDLPVNDKIRPVCIHSKYFNYHINELKEKRLNFNNRLKRSSSLTSKISTFISSQYNKLFGGVEVVDAIDDKMDEDSVGLPFNSKKSELRPTKSSIKNDGSSLKQAKDKDKIILNHPDKNLIRTVLETVYDYYQQIKNDQKVIFDPAKEFTEDKLTVVGWGSTDRYDFSILPDVLMETEVIQKKSEICENAYGDDVFFRSKMICANDEETDSCSGDSGGPLTTKTYGRMNLYGVVSYGRACGSYSSPGVYTRISAFLEWILLHTIESKFCLD